MSVQNVELCPYLRFSSREGVLYLATPGPMIKTTAKVKTVCIFDLRMFSVYDPAVTQNVGFVV